MNWKPLLKWSRENYCDLPWRKNRTLYTTLVSEIMLQQTTVSTVLNHFERFLKQFPDIQRLSQASEEEMVMAWKGLGYYRRARSLLSAAVEICERFGGEIPLDRDDLLSIKGIGPYTASAITAIGANKAELALDANLERVIARLYLFDQEKGPKLQRAIRESYIQSKILTGIEKHPRDINEALMDLGRVFCQARKADCVICPLQNDCQAYQTGQALEFPVVSLKTKTKTQNNKHDLTLLRIVVQKGEKVLGTKKQVGQWLEGQVEVPTYILSTSDKKLNQYPRFEGKKAPEPDFEFKTGITKYKISNVVVKMTEADFKNKFSDQDTSFYSVDTKKANLATSTIKILGRL
jgi:A/G-specific adenine glycosylase